MKTSILSLVMLVLFFQINQSFAQNTTTVENIIKNPITFEGTEVEIIGWVTQYVEGKGTTNYYLLKGYYGSIIRVNTSESAPEINQKYKVRGIVYIDQTKNQPFISEKSKVLMNIIKDQEPIVSSTKRDTAIFFPKEESSTNWLLIILVGVLFILLLLFIYFQFIKKNKEPEFLLEDNYGGNYQAPSKSNLNESEPIFTSDTEFKTIKITKSSTTPKTLKFIPGKLVITKGSDKGKEFKIAGYPSPEGFIVSIGRKEVTGEKAFAHIQLKEMTVSREQAELIQKDGKLFIKNLSETNYTQLNGKDLMPGQVAEVVPGSTITTGEVEFQYTL